MFYLTRTILLAVCLAILSTNSYVKAQNKPCVNQIDRWSSGNELNIVGSVKTIRIEEQIYEFEGDFLYKNDTPLLKERFEFDRQGKKSEDYTYTIDGRESPKTLGNYNDRKWLIRQDTYSGLTSQPYLETRYLYDKNGNVLEAAQYSLDDNKLLQKWAFVQDASKNYFEFTDTDSRNQWRGRIEFTKDAQCRIFEISEFQQDGKLTARTTLSFNDKNITITATTCSATGEILRRVNSNMNLMVTETGQRNQILP